MEKNEMKSPFIRLIEFAKPNKNNFILSVILAILGVASGMIPYFAASNIILNLIDGNKDMFYYFILCSILAIGFILKVVFMNLSTKISHKATFETLKEIRFKLIKKLSKVPMGYILETPSSKLKSIIVDRVESLESTLAHIIPEMTSNLTVPIVILIYIFILDWKMALVSLITLPLGFICFFGLMKDYEEKFKGLMDAGKEMNKTVVEYINGIEVIKAFNQSANSYEKYSDSVNYNASYAVNWMRSVQLFMSMVFSIWPGVLASVLPFGCYFNAQGKLSTHIFITIIILSLGIVGPILAVVNYTDEISQSGAIIAEICKMLDMPELKRPIKRKKLDDLTIEFKNVSFSYDKNSNVLKNINLKINQGEITALVGLSGSGKSTITKLIAGFWDTTLGSVNIGGINIKEIPQNQLMEYIAYVSQDNYLFDDTIRENIRMGKSKATDKEVEDAAKATGCHDFIMKLENGYETKVGGSGGHLSGGERQRIAIARAMLKDAPIVILDEATAYTDPENEAIIQEAVAKLIVGKTLILIVHRLSTIIDSDKIIVVNKGEIIGEGTHKKLLKDCSSYNSMWEAHISAKDKE